MTCYPIAQQHLCDQFRDAICLIGTRIATAIFSLVDDEDAPEAMTGDDSPNARETADR